MHTPSVKLSISARTTGKWRQQAKKAPSQETVKRHGPDEESEKKAVYNTAYRNAALSLWDLFKVEFHQPSEERGLRKHTDIRQEMNNDEDCIANKAELPLNSIHSFCSSCFRLVNGLPKPISNSTHGI